MPGECNCNAGWSGKDCNESKYSELCLSDLLTVQKQFANRDVNTVLAKSLVNAIVWQAGKAICAIRSTAHLRATVKVEVVLARTNAHVTRAILETRVIAVSPRVAVCLVLTVVLILSPDCTFPKPAELAECTVIDGNSVWVVNGSLTVNSTTTVNNPVIIYGDLQVTDSGLLVVNGTTISVYGCVDIKNQSSLVVTLTPQEIEELQNNGVLNRTVVTYSPLCDTANDFGIISISNPGQCM